MKKLIAALLSVIVLVPEGCAAVQPVVSPSLSAVSPSTATVSALPTVSASPSPSAAASPSETPASPPASATSVKSPADYFPVKADTRMVYQGIGNEFAGFVQYTDYIANGAFQLRTNNSGTETVTVYTAGSDAVAKVFQQHETYFRYDYTAERATNEPLIKAPIAVGTVWILPNGSTRSITAVSADVTVPYGTFTALEVTTKDADSTIKEYYSPGVGLVKRVFTSKDDPSYEVSSVLEKVETGSTLTQGIRFYYPDFNRNKVAYIDKKIAFHTGDTLAPKIEAELKKVPQNSGLTPVLSSGAKINSITFDSAGGIVTIDLSKSFITGMNAGTQLEGQILESLGDTLGNYFLTNKVAVTIDGGPYESGHFLFGKGDFLPARPEEAVAYTS